MQKLFTDVQIGEEFKVKGRFQTFIKIPFMKNFFKTTGNKRNARLKYSTSKMNEKYSYIEDSQKVEVLGK